MTETDVSAWKTYEDFSDGIATNRLPSTSVLAGTDLEVALDDDSDVTLRFTGASSLEWTVSGGRAGAGSGTGWYDAVELGDETLFVDTRFDERPLESVTVIVSGQTRAALAIRSAIDDEKQPGLPRVRQSFVAGTLGERGVARAEEPAPSRDLVGRRALHRYSANHLYEHVYLSSERYCWQCLEGVERGLADVDPATTYRFDQDRYLLAFREYVLDVASVFFLDLRRMRSTGKFFGITEDGVVENAPTGAHITMIGPAGYPDGVEPV